MATDIKVSSDNHVALVEIVRPPNNFFDLPLILDIADAFEALDKDDNCRAIVLAAEGKNFCAGADFSNRGAAKSAADKKNKVEPTELTATDNPLYTAAVRLFDCKKPVVGAIQGAAVGGGFGLALVPDFRVICAETRFTANFTKLGFHPGFGLTYTLPNLVGSQRANLMFYTGRRISGETAMEWGLGDVFTDKDKVREEAFVLAREIAESAPLAVESVRATMRQGFAEGVKRATDHESAEQYTLQLTSDHKEGLRAVAERRPGNFKRC
ncbi:MAG: enoyl-CoA hydratase/isomerase family protein [Pseudomonadales bacterium]|nr:enoyl-CoA hydratase/isomerase family protein [Pseudomonadales bacterium]